MKKLPRLTDLEIKIMNVLQEHDQGLTIQEIAGYLKEEKISAQSVTQAMQRMIKKKIVRVTDHLLVVSVYTRVFVPTCSREAFTVAEIERLHKSLWGGKKSTTNMLALTLMDFMKENSKSDISLEDMKDLRQTIDQYIKKQDKE